MILYSINRDQNIIYSNKTLSKTHNKNLPQLGLQDFSLFLLNEMNLFVRSNPSLCLHIHGVLRALCFSTDTTAISHSLKRRISMVEDPMVPIIPVIEKWIQEGQVVINSDLKHFIRKLRKIHRFSHALQVPLTFIFLF